MKAQAQWRSRYLLKIQLWLSNTGEREHIADQSFRPVVQSNIDGHAMAGLSRWKPEFIPRPVTVGFVMDKVALDRFFSENFCCAPYSLIQVSRALH
jgi:hypothetical protein